MPADRLLHPRAGHSLKISSLTDLEYRVWTQYLLSADDFGVMRGDVLAFQAENDALAQRSARTIQKAIDALLSCSLILGFIHQQHLYLCQADWQRWQKVEYPRTTDNPKPPENCLAECDDATRLLFDKHPGGSRRRSEDVPKVSQTSPECVPTTRARGRAERLTANGIRLTANGLEGGVGGTIQPLDGWLAQLMAAYPENRRTTGYRTQTAFVEQFQQDPRPYKAVFDEMTSNLDNQKRGYEWRVKGMVPSLEKWLSDGRWRQRHDEAPPSALVSDRTARTLAAAASVIKGGAS